MNNRTCWAIVVCVLLAMGGCETQMQSKPSKVIKINTRYGYKYDVDEFTYDGCDYIMIRGGCLMGIAHKGNCRRCKTIEDQSSNH